MFMNYNNYIHGAIDFVNLFQLILLSIGTFFNVFYYYYNTIRLVLCFVHYLQGLKSNLQYRKYTLSLSNILMSTD